MAMNWTGGRAKPATATYQNPSAPSTGGTITPPSQGGGAMTGIAGPMNQGQARSAWQKLIGQRTGQKPAAPNVYGPGYPTGQPNPMQPAQPPYQPAQRPIQHMQPQPGTPYSPQREVMGGVPARAAVPPPQTPLRPQMDESLYRGPAVAQNDPGIGNQWTTLWKPAPKDPSQVRQPTETPPDALAAPLQRNGQPAVQPGSDLGMGIPGRPTARDPWMSDPWMSDPWMSGPRIPTPQGTPSTGRVFPNLAITPGTMPGTGGANDLGQGLPRANQPSASQNDPARGSNAGPTLAPPPPMVMPPAPAPLNTYNPATSNRRALAPGFGPNGEQRFQPNPQDLAARPSPNHQWNSTAQRWDEPVFGFAGQGDPAAAAAAARQTAMAAAPAYQYRPTDQYGRPLPANYQNPGV